MEAIREATEKASGYLKENPDAATGTGAAATAVREDGLEVSMATEIVSRQA
jgi:hypothetical protein